MKVNYWAKFQPETYYHIYNRSVGRERLFSRTGNYHFFMEKWWKYLGPYFDTYAYCLIPNHFHFLAKCKTISPKLLKTIEGENTSASRKFLLGQLTQSQFLESQFKRFFTSYAGAYNKERKRHGSLFQAKFKRIPIRSKKHFHYLLAYIHHNPIHHQLCQNYQDWPFSSYLLYLSQLPSPIDCKTVFHTFEDGTSPNPILAFIHLHQQFANQGPTTSAA